MNIYIYEIVILLLSTHGISTLFYIIKVDLDIIIMISNRFEAGTFIQYIVYVCICACYVCVCVWVKCIMNLEGQVAFRHVFF